MSNLTRLQAVSSSLDTAINKANSLPDAGGGGSLETCEVLFDCIDSLSVQMVATVVENGVETIYTTDGDCYSEVYPPLTLSNVKCGSAIVIEMGDDFMSPTDRFVEIEGGATLVKSYQSSSVDRAGKWTTTWVFKAPTTAGSIGSIMLA